MRRALQKYIEDPLSEALIQGILPRPAEFEIYLGDTGIYYRQVNMTVPEAVPVAVGDGGSEAEIEVAPVGPGVALYPF